MSERGSDDDVVHVECYVKPEQKESKPAIKSNGGGGEILEAAVQEHQMSSLQENHQLTVLKLRVIGKLLLKILLCMLDSMFIRSSVEASLEATLSVSPFRYKNQFLCYS